MNKETADRLDKVKLSDASKVMKDIVLQREQDYEYLMEELHDYNQGFIDGYDIGYRIAKESEDIILPFSS